MTDDTASAPGGLNVSPTGWALLGLLTSGDELSGYDIKKWIDWAIRFFYSSPAYSQIYSELKRLERLGLVSSRVDAGIRSRRMYRITEQGQAAVSRWANEDPVEPPSLKHNPMLRVMLGHLLKPGRLREILTEHAAYAEQLHQAAATEVRWTSEQPAWAYARLALKWSEQYYAVEREMALQMIKDLDAVQDAFGENPAGVQFPVREYWYEVERRIAAEDQDDDPAAD
ncbi:PadR family transcriptional regulator [Mycolicibacterium diernhoferi]|uniref:PadR family transcriptional regulator n=1 Tax=Mycolicibacterium diernhoferi TaxID=1801 RepID=A0A1Q4H7B1_9MYCO|nr:PadR family transcriptional regulator [Mycolicibacterium diernhoferi]OJZ63439.1 PadR family transcriptional regulator [Mycolicibacterium diernhoferi]OPE53713.1 PadR family transcriptional regulator [Mycolicibacterium diernhoferi]PEG53981.1 PadR family transcriptional regulator [Mycolicibacterium diernhoferi]